MTYSRYKLLVKTLGLDPELCGISITSTMQYFYYGQKYIADDLCDIKTVIEILKNKGR